ncbi:hypothetical protein, partial [Mesorhizobium sp.]|uniref:hypothetical protein n=1 Tax=Mesorhizobium sp. TaxID=1871066 RepID=UPI00257A61B6
QVTRKGNATLCSLEADHMPFLMPANAHPVFHEARAHGGKDAGRSVHRADLQPFSGREQWLHVLNFRLERVFPMQGKKLG